jgi:DNA polymerase-3 subunit epsilon
MLNWLKKSLNLGSALPKQWRDEKLSALPLLSVDFEFSGLEAKKAKFLSAGWIQGQGHQIDLSSAYYALIRANTDLAQSPVIHGLTKDSLIDGVHAEEMYSALITFSEKAVFVVHNAQLDMVMLENLAQKLGKTLPHIVVLDTMQLALYQLNKEHTVIPNDAATLGACRERFGFPLAPVHNALDDAQATLELWLAQRHQIDPKSVLTLQDLKRTGAVKVFGEIR